MTDHTPGPWTEDNEDPRELARDFGGITIVASNGGDGATFTAIAVGSGPEAVANARLIAAAPDLLAALEAIANMTVDENTDHAQLSALCIAIAGAAKAKVTG